MGPLMLLHFGSVPVLVVSSAEAAREIMKAHDLTFSNRPKSTIVEKLPYNYNHVTFAPYGEYWKQVKSISVLNLLTNKRVRSFRSVREEETISMIRNIKQSSSSLDDKMVEKVGGDDDKNDFVDVLLAVQKENLSGIPIDTVTIKALILDMFAAGTDTSSTFLEWAMTELLRHPRVMNKLQKEVRGIVGSKTDVLTEDDLVEMHYLKAVIKETLRLHTPLPLLVPRLSTQDVEINGFNIKAKTQVIINACHIGRDPKAYDVDAMNICEDMKQSPDPPEELPFRILLKGLLPHPLYRNRVEQDFEELFAEQHVYDPPEEIFGMRS